MWRIRLFEERVGLLKRADEVHGLIHLSVGQEGVAAAVCSQLRDDDAVYSGHRAHGHAIAKGAPLDRVMAELMGRDDRPLPRARRVDAPGRRRARLHGGDRRRRGQHPDRARQRAGGAAARRGLGRGRLLRRRRGAGGPLQRDREPRGALEAAADPRLREQRLRGVHAALGAHGRRAGQRRGRALRARARDGRRQRRRRGVGRVRALPRRGARGSRPVPARVPDPPPARPLRGRSGQVPRGARRRGLAGEGPDRAAPAPRDRAGLVRGRRRCWRSSSRSPRRSSRRCASGARARSRTPA